LTSRISDCSALRHVAHNRDHHRFGKVLERVKHDVDRKRGAIRASRDEVEACPHRPHSWLRSVFGAMGDMTFSEMLGQQCLDRGRDECFRILQEQLAGLTIGVPYDTLPINSEDRIR
jgi:hypothetical protein